ncbi:hypothetical protein HED49_20125 [Ochrobactrum daejeonense]|nr:hypothetical protein [Brucella daejeonensis]
MPVNRRLVLAGGIAAAAFYGAPRLASALTAPDPVTWRGQAMGAPARIIVYHPDWKTAERLIRESVREAGRRGYFYALSSR